MAYAGIQTMLLAYKMRKSDKEFEATQIMQSLRTAKSDSSSIVELREEKLSALDKDDVNYDTQYNEIEKEYNNSLAEITAWEDDLEQQKSDCQTEIAELNGYIQSWTTALQSNIAKAHTYGAQ